MGIKQKLESLEPGTSVNLVLSGGGVRGVAHTILIEYLEKRDIRINAISGTSAGALVGALYASGSTTNDIIHFFKETPIFKYAWLNPMKAGIFNTDKYEEVLAKYVNNNFESLSIPLTVCATNIEENRSVYFSEGDLIKPLLASCAIPAVFTPVDINGQLYSDGGIMDNFPVAPFLNDNTPLMGSYVFKPGNLSKSDLNSILKVTIQSNSLLLYTANSYKFKDTFLTLDFPLVKFSTFDTKRIDDIYLTAKTFLQGILE